MHNSENADVILVRKRVLVDTMSKNIALCSLPKTEHLSGVIGICADDACTPAGMGGIETDPGGGVVMFVAMMVNVLNAVEMMAMSGGLTVNVDSVDHLVAGAEHAAPVMGNMFDRIGLAKALVVMKVVIRIADAIGSMKEM